jgi:hypothetical protein
LIDLPLLPNQDSPTADNTRLIEFGRFAATGGRFELSNQYDHAWLNGANEYVMSDDPNFNPNGKLNGNWNQLDVVRPQP